MITEQQREQAADLIAHNQERWDALVSADVAYSRPLLDLDVEAARKWVLNEGWIPPEFLEQIMGKDVLCLASGGGSKRPFLAHLAQMSLFLIFQAIS